MRPDHRAWTRRPGRRARAPAFVPDEALKGGDREERFVHDEADVARRRAGVLDALDELAEADRMRRRAICVPE